MLEDEGVAPRPQGSCEITFIPPPSPVYPLKEIHRQMGILIAMAVVTGHALTSWSPNDEEHHLIY
ncbi:unnamed protein product [Prunus armeniaca]